MRMCKLQRKIGSSFSSCCLFHPLLETFFCSGQGESHMGNLCEICCFMQLEKEIAPCSCHSSCLSAVQFAYAPSPHIPVITGQLFGRWELSHHTSCGEIRNKYSVKKWFISCCPLILIKVTPCIILISAILSSSEFI